MRDNQIADWAWGRFARDEFEGARSDAAMGRRGDAATGGATRTSGDSGKTPTGESAAPAQRVVAPLGDNLFPTNVQHYVALPQPGAAIGRLVTGLTNLQMPTARSQAE